ncbi:MAG: extracellular solute-binding protein [Dorea sp.]
MKKKKLIALGLVAVMAASLAACGSSDSSSSDDSSSSSGSSDSDKVITFWNIGVENPDALIMQYAVDQYNQNDSAESGYTIETTSIQNDKYKEKLVIAMSSGECPDMYTSWSGGPLREYIDSGYAQPITDLYKEAGLDQIYMEAAAAQATFDGELYGVPMLNISISGVFYNKDLFDKYNLEEPTTISELEEVCDTLVANGVTPFALGNSSKWQGSMFYQGLATRYAGLDDFRAAYDGSGSFEADCFIYAGDKILEWAEKGYFQEGCNGVSTDDGQDRQALYQEKAAMLYSGSWYTGTLSADSEEFYSHMGWFPFPECDEVDNGAEYANICNGTVGDQFISFNCTDEKLKEAFKCVTYYSTDDCISLMVENGKIPPVNNAADLVSDPLAVEICEYVENATDVQLWYDQYLPTAVANAHLDNSQLLFTQETTSEEVAAATQKAMADYLADK